MSSFWNLTAFVVGCIAVTEPALAQEKAECSGRITRSNLISCALASSLVVRSEQDTTRALEGRRTAATPLLPSNPEVAFTGARRNATGTEPTVINWSATLSQELEVAGQRAKRLQEADAELDAQRQRVLLSKRDTALLAWTAYFEVAAAQEEQVLSQRLLETSQRMSEVTRAKADKGLVSLLDAEVADAATLRVLQSKLAAERALSTAMARLSYLLGRGADASAVTVEGDLTPLTNVTDAMAGPGSLSQRPEMLIFEAERRAMTARADAFRRSRISNPTLSVFALNDGYNERVYGVGIAFPIPLPTPVGRTYAGEIAEAEALAQRAQTEQSRRGREIQLEVAATLATFVAHRRMVEALKPEALQRAETALRDLGQEIEAGRMAVREALFAQQTLIDMLRNNIAERAALCLASVELARALGLPLEKGAQ